MYRLYVKYSLFFCFIGGIIVINKKISKEEFLYHNTEKLLKKYRDAELTAIKKVQNDITTLIKN